MMMVVGWFELKEAVSLYTSLSLEYLVVLLRDGTERKRTIWERGDRGLYIRGPTLSSTLYGSTTLHKAAGTGTGRGSLPLGIYF